MSVNLLVARGLLEPYELSVDTAASGQEAIEKIQAAVPQYDLVFMDHMMPVMDGVEAVRIIRAWEAEKEHTNDALIPIIALTANALTGNMEMFLSRGFNGFISKPIDVLQLDEALNKWIRNEEISHTGYLFKDEEYLNPAPNIHTLNQGPFSKLPDIPGIDIQRGIKMTGGSLEIYIEILATFCDDVELRLPILRTFPIENDIVDFTTMVHALKSASASIAAAEVSALAAKLETAGEKKDFTYIEKQLPIFTYELEELARNINSALEPVY